MAYPVVLKQLSSRLVVPFCPAVATDVVFDRFSTTFRRAYRIRPQRLSLIPKTRTPHSSKTEDAEHLELKVQMPGLETKDVKATVKKGEYYYLNITGMAYDNLNTTKFSRNYTMPKDINMNGITAKMNDGLLKVTLPKLKREEILPDKLMVKIN